MASLANYLKDAEVKLDEQEFAARKSASYMLWIIGAFLIVFLIWAGLTQIDRTVRGMGRVAPSSKLQVISNLEGGIVEQILVRPGQVVRKGDILVRLSPTLSTSAYGSSKASVGALQARIGRLSAEVRGNSPSYGNADGSQVAVEQALHAARRAELQGLLSAGEARARQAERAVAEAQSTLASRRANVATAKRELDLLRPLAEKQIVSQVDFLKAENAYTVAVNEVASAEAAVARAQSGVAEARASTAQARSDWMSRSGTELSQAQAELSAQQQTLPALSDRVDRTAVRAPMSGRVNRVLVTTTGGTVSVGMPIVEIVPTEDALYVEVMIRPSDIANVHLAQAAKIEITAYNSSIFGSLEGRVTSISPDAVVNEKTGESHYLVEVQTSKPLRDGDGRILPIGPGMMANVNLVGEKRSVLSYLFSPITKLSENAFRE